MSDDTLPKPVWSGSFMLGDVEMRCHVLDDGSRIIDASSLDALWGREGEPLTQEQMTEFLVWLKAPQP